MQSLELSSTYPLTTDPCYIQGDESSVNFSDESQPGMKLLAQKLDTFKHSVILIFVVAGWQLKRIMDFINLVPENISISSPQRLTPFAFSTPHIRASFAPNGQLVILPPSNIVNGQVAAMEICDVQVGSHPIIIK